MQRIQTCTVPHLQLPRQPVHLLRCHLPVGPETGCPFAEIELFDFPSVERDLLQKLNNLQSAFSCDVLSCVFVRRDHSIETVCNNMTVQATVLLQFVVILSIVVFVNGTGNENIH